MPPQIFDSFTIQKERLRRRRKIVLLLFLLIFLLLGVSYTVVYSPLFQIRQFLIVGSDYLSPEETLAILKPIVFQNAIQKFLGDRNLISWIRSQPDVQGTALLSAQIKKKWIQQSLEIRIQERNRFVIWCLSQTECYWVDQDGIAFGEAPHSEGSLFLLVNDPSNDQLAMGQPVLEDRFLANTIKILQGIKELRLPFQEILLDRELQELRVRNNQGPAVLFSLRFDPTLNLSALRSLKSKNNLSGIQYIDLRVENRLYYKN